MQIFLTSFLLVAVLCSLPAPGQGVQTTYQVAYFQNQDPAVGGLFTDYLNDNVGHLFDPPITFEGTPGRSPGFPDFPELIEAGMADFLYAPAILLSCYNAKYDYAPIGTAKMKVGSELLAGAIITMADNEDIVSLADVRGKVVVGLPVPVLTGFQLQAATLAAAGVHVLQDAKQVIFVNRYTELNEFEVLLAGHADVAFVLDQNLAVHPERDRFRILHNVAPAEEIPRSTSQIPQFGFLARPGLDQAVQQAVMRALMDVNASHPAAAATKIERFNLPASYGLTRSVMEEQGTIFFNDADGVWDCYTSPSLNFEAISCPAGHLKLDKQSVLSGCQDKALPCPLPAPASCVCQPCIRAEEVTLRCPTSLTAIVECKRTQLCAETQQRRPLRCLMTDNLLRDPANITVAFRLTNGGSALTEGTGVFVGNFTYEFSVQTSAAGSFLLEVFLGDQQVSASPTYARVAPRSCEHEGALREADEAGECVCASRATMVMGACHLTAHVALTIGLPLLALLALALLFWVRRKLRATGNAIWIIPLERLEFDDNPEVLGSGAYGVVLKATYQGTEVAVKRAITRKSTTGRRVSTIGFRPTPSAVSDTAQVNSLGGAGGTAGPKDVPGGRPPALNSPHPPASPSYRSLNRRVSSEPSREASLGLNDNMGPALSPPSAAFLPPSPPPDEQVRPSARRASLGETTGRNTARLSDTHSSSAAGASGFAHEMRTLASLRHPNITTVMGAAKTKAGDYMLVMEYMQHGSLSDLLANAAIALDGEILHPLLCDIVGGMTFLHSANPVIVHGDLKPSNVLVDERFRAKIADFGMANTKHRRAGTELWMAPEVLNGGRPSTASDVFSFSILLAEALSRKMPYDGMDVARVVEEVADQAIQRRPDVPASSPEMLQLMMRKCWAHEPTERLSFASMQAMMSAINLSEYPSSAKKEAGQGIVYDMFPRHVADALMKGETVPDDRAECASVFFSDIVGFTSLSATLDSHQVSAMLDSLFVKMDAAAKSIGIHKIETIGDCYIAVSNLVQSQQGDHATRMARFSLAAMQACRDTLIDPHDPSKGSVVIRVGFDSGPVVGSVVGTSYKKYTIFGNTVNTASRMESTGVPGRIQCTERAAELLRKEGLGEGREFCLEERGTVEVKGKGAMTTYFVNAGGSGQAPLPAPADAEVTLSPANLVSPAANTPVVPAPTVTAVSN